MRRGEGLGCGGGDGGGVVVVVKMMKWTVEIERVYGEAWLRMEMK